MATYLHIAPNTYNAGEDLLSWDAYCEQYGEAPTAWKWDEAEEGFDTDIVSLFRDDQRGEAMEYAAEFGGEAPKMLTIEIEDGEEGVRILTNSEGYVCIVGRVPAWAIMSVETL